MDSLVDLQVGGLVEGLPADTTDVSLVALRVADRPHTAVDPAVVLEVGLLAEGSGALVTFEGFQSAVAELVCFQREGAGEAFPADATDEDLLAGVGVSVAVQVLQHAEVAAAHLTGVWLLSGVDPHVNGQTVFLVEPSAADAAAEGLLDAVDHRVPLEMRRPRERLAALRTLVRLIVGGLPRGSLQNDRWRAANDLLLLEVRGHRLRCINLSSWRKKSVSLKSVVDTNETNRKEV